MCAVGQQVQNGTIANCCKEMETIFHINKKQFFAAQQVFDGWTNHSLSRELGKVNRRDLGTHQKWGETVV